MHWNEARINLGSFRLTLVVNNFFPNRFAVVEMKIALAKILVNYEFSLDRSKTSVPIKFATDRILLAPAEGIMINFKKI